MLPPSGRITERMGSPAYAAPEVVASKTGDFLAEPAVVWALGVILYILLTGTYPFSGLTVSTLIARIKCGQFTIPPSTPPLSLTAESLISCLLKADPEQRLKLRDILQHAWFRADLNSVSRSASSRNSALGASMSSTVVGAAAQPTARVGSTLVDDRALVNRLGVRPDTWSSLVDAGGQLGESVTAADGSRRRLLQIRVPLSAGITHSQLVVCRQDSTNSTGSSGQFSADEVSSQATSSSSGLSRSASTNSEYGVTSAPPESGDSVPSEPALNPVSGGQLFAHLPRPSMQQRDGQPVSDRQASFAPAAEVNLSDLVLGATNQLHAATDVVGRGSDLGVTGFTLTPSRQGSGQAAPHRSTSVETIRPLQDGGHFSRVQLSDTAPFGASSTRATATSLPGSPMAGRSEDQSSSSGVTVGMSFGALTRTPTPNRMITVSPDTVSAAVTNELRVRRHRRASPHQSGSKRARVEDDQIVPNL